LATTASRAICAVLILIPACGGGGSTDPCEEALETALESALDDVVIDGSTSTASPSVSFHLAVTNPSELPARISGYLLECRYLSPDSSMLRGSGTTEITLGPGESRTMTPTCLPGIVSWTGSPTGDDLRCTVEAVYSYDECEGTPPRSSSSVSGADEISLIYP
jgi:hypothetical protein